MIRNRSKLLLDRFKERENLGKVGLYETFFKPLGYDQQDVLDCLEEIELGYEIPSGVLRPEDHLSKLNERVEASNPIEWVWWLGQNEFAADGLTEELRRRVINFGTEHEWKSIETFGDLVAAWCGRSPTSS